MTSVLGYLFGALLAFGIMLSSTVHFFRCEGESKTPKTSGFIYKYKKTIPRVGNLFLVVHVLIWCLISMRMPIDALQKALTEPEEIGWVTIRGLSALFLTSMIDCSGTGAAAAGFLSFFLLDLTKAKRLVLLIICLLPSISTVLLLLVTPTDDLGIVIELGCLYSGMCWMINAPSILLGKHWFQLASTLLARLGFVPKGIDP